MVFIGSLKPDDFRALVVLLKFQQCNYTYTHFNKNNFLPRVTTDAINKIRKGIENYLQNMYKRKQVFRRRIFSFIKNKAFVKASQPRFIHQKYGELFNLNL